MKNAADYLFLSDRLGFRPWRDDDIRMFATLNSDPQVMEYFPKLATYEETAAQVERFRKSYALSGFCFFAVDRRDTGQFIGFTGLNQVTFAAAFTPCVEIGWRLMRTAWGQGFATEGAMRCLQYAFNDLNLAEVYSFTAVPNLRSERVMQKAGMKKWGEFLHPALPEGHWLQPHVVYKSGAGEL